MIETVKEQIHWVGVQIKKKEVLLLWPQIYFITVMCRAQGTAIKDVIENAGYLG